MQKFILSSFLLLLIPSLCFALLPYDTIWEVRTTGNDNNGGGYDNGGAGTDYSQQDAAQEDWCAAGCNQTNDLASTSASSWLTLTSAAGGFTAVMVDNLIHITAGTNFTAGHYEVTAYTNANTVTLDRACGSVGDASAGTGYLGGALATPQAAADGMVERSNYVFIKAGTYTSAAAQILDEKQRYVNWIGYNATRGDNPHGTDRPFFNGEGARNYGIIADGNGSTGGSWYNFRIDNCVDDCVNNIKSGNFYNFKVSNCGDYGFDGATSGNLHAYFVEVATSTDDALDSTGGSGSGFQTYWSYIHDSSAYGLNVNGDSDFIYSVVESNAGDGVEDSFRIINSIAYNNTGGTSQGFDEIGSTNLCIGSIAHDNGQYGFRGETAVFKPLFNYNIYEGNGTAGTNGLTAGDNDSTSDPLFNQPGSGDFTITAGSPALDASFPYWEWVGLTGDYKQNIGIDQDDLTVGGGGGGSAGHVVVF